MRKIVIASLIILICSFALIPATAYAWVSFIFVFSDNDFTTGQLAPQTELYFWNTESAEPNKWTAAPASSNGQSIAFSPNFGTITNLAEVPEGMGVYLKIKVDDQSGAVYQWEVTVADIIIKAYDSNNDEIVASEQNNIGNINYFTTASDAQNCFYYSTATGSNNLLPTSVSYGQNTSLIEKGQSLSDGFLSQETWLYVYIRPSLTELQNILRCIPIDKSPYAVRFEFTITGEGRTVDYE